MRQRNKRSTRGVSAVEACVVFAVVGTFLAVFMPKFLTELSLRKTVEASEQLAAMHARTAAYFDATRDIEGRSLRWCLPPAAGPSPPTPSIEPVEASFEQRGMPGHVTWKALGFQPPPARYRYSFIPEAEGCGLRREANDPLVTYVAEGDLDGDGVLSLFEASAGVTVEGHLVRLGGVRVTRETE